MNPQQLVSGNDNSSTADSSLTSEAPVVCAETTQIGYDDADSQIPPNEYWIQ